MKFEYTFTKLESPAYMNDVVANFNVMGQQGWELVGSFYGNAFWKRECDMN